MKKSGLSRLQVRRAMAVGLSLLLAVTAVPANNYAEAAAKKPTVKKSASVNMNGTKKLTITKNGWTVKKVTVKSSKTSVAKVTKTKKAVTVYGIKDGKATITTKIKAKKGSKTKTYTIKTKVTVKKLSASLSKKSIAVGKTAKVTVKNKVSKATVKYSTSNKKVATVSKGTVKGVKAGKATITVKVTLPKTKKAKKTTKTFKLAVTVTAASATATPSASADASAAPGTDTSAAPSADVSAAPGTDASAAPGTDASAAPSADASNAPEGSTTPVETAAPSADASGAPASSAPGTNNNNSGFNPAPSADVTTGTSVTSNDELKAALLNGDKNITLNDASGNENAKYVIDNKDYSKVDLIVDAPNSDVTNAATFNSITIKAVRNGTWHEKGKGNKFTLANTSPISMAIEEGAEVKNITISGAQEAIAVTASSTARVDAIDVQDTEKAVNIAAIGEAEIASIEIAKISGESAAVAVEAKGKSTIGTITTRAEKKDAVKVISNSDNGIKVVLEGKAKVTLDGTKEISVNTEKLTEKTNAVKMVNEDTVVKLENAESSTDVNEIIDNRTGNNALTVKDMNDEEQTVKLTPVATITTQPVGGEYYVVTGSATTTWDEFYTVGTIDTKKTVTAGAVTASGEAVRGDILKVAASKENTTNELTYQWYASQTDTSVDDPVEGEKIAGANTASYKPSFKESEFAANKVLYYYVVVGIENEKGAETAISQKVKVTFNMYKQ